MQLPLTAVVQAEDDNLVAIFEAKTNRRICMLYGNTSSEDAYDIVVAVNERAAMQAEIERLRAKLSLFDPPACPVCGETQVWTVPARKFERCPRCKTVIETLEAALDAPEEPRP